MATPTVPHKSAHLSDKTRKVTVFMYFGKHSGTVTSRMSLRLTGYVKYVLGDAKRIFSAVSRIQSVSRNA
jgi:hypothetical protein